MNILSRDKQIQIIAALVDGLGIRATARVTDTDRKTVARLALSVGHGCAELHDRMMVGLRVSRLELDELWAFVGKKQSRDVVSGVPADISTSYVERSNLSIRMSCRRFTRLTNAFSKKLENHCAAVSLYVAYYNLCRVHESLRSTPAMALGIADRVWTIGDLIDAALATQPIAPVTTAPDRRKRFRVIEGGRE